MVLGAFAPSIACARLIRKNLIIDNELYFPDRLPHEDLFFTYKALWRAKSCGDISNVIYFYRQRGDSLSKVANRDHIDTLFAQWRDGDAFLASNSARPLARSLLARRTIILLEGFRKRTAATGDADTVQYLQDQMIECRPGLENLVADIRQSKVANSYLPAAAMNLIDTIEKIPPENGPFRIENVIFPFDAIDFNGYLARETNEIKADSDKISDLYNAYKGKRCFIIGNGPSLNRHDLRKLRNEYTFAVNSIFYKGDELGFRPTFYVVEDNLVMKENIDRIKAYDAPLKLFPTGYKELYGKSDNVIYFSENQGFYTKSNPNYAIPRFSTDASKELFCGQTVTYINMQLDTSNYPCSRAVRIATSAVTV